MVLRRRLGEIKIAHFISKRHFIDQRENVSILVSRARSCDLNGGSSLTCDLIEGGGPGNSGGAISGGGAGRR